MGNKNYLRNKKNYSLILTSDLEKIDKYNNKLSLNSNNLTNYKKSIEYVNFPSKTKKEIIKIYDLTHKLTDNLINDLFSEFNKVHNYNFSKNFWKLIIFNWVYSLVKSSIKVYSQLDYTFKNYNISDVVVKKVNNFTFKDTLDFETTALFSEDWYNFLQVKIIKNFNFCKKIKYYSIKKKNNKIIEKKNKKITNLLFYLGSKFYKFLRKFFKLNNYAVIKKTYLPFFYEKILEIKLFQIPSFWEEEEIKYNGINKKFRSEINLSKSKEFSAFENFLRNFLVDQIPMCFLENFKEIQNLSHKYPINPKFIFTSNAHYYDEIFKVYISSKKEHSNTPIFFGQHGGNFFSSIHTNKLNEIFFPNRFISWGVKKKKVLLSAFNFKTLGKKIQYNKNGKLVIIFPNISNNNYHLYSYEHDIKSQISQLLNIIKNLKPEIKRNTIIKLKPDFKNIYFGTNYLNIFKKLNIDLDFDTDFYDILSKARLILFSYFSTGVLENLILNMPTIIYKKQFNEISKNYVSKYNKLFKSKILFNDEIKIAKFINNNWNNLENLWMSKKNQEILNSFNNNYNNKPSLQKLKKMLREIVKLSNNE